MGRQGRDRRPRDGERGSDYSERALDLGGDCQVSEPVGAIELDRLVFDLTHRGRAGACLSSRRPAPHPAHGLTPRELDVLHRITEGMTNQEIADDLFLSVNSVKTYVRTAYRKIGVNSRTQVVRWLLLQTGSARAELDPRTILQWGHPGSEGSSAVPAHAAGDLS